MPTSLASLSTVAAENGGDILVTPNVWGQRAAHLEQWNLLHFDGTHAVVAAVLRN